MAFSHGKSLNPAQGAGDLNMSNGPWTSVHVGQQRLGHPSAGEMHSRRVNPTVQLFRGTERLCSLTVPASAPPGTNLLLARTRVDFNPLLVGVRLPLEARIYAKFQFKRLVLHYVPDVNAVTANAQGSMLIGFNSDPDALGLDTGDDAVNAIASWGHNADAVRYIDYTSMEFDLSLQQQSPLFVDSNEERRFSSQGFLIAVNEATSPAAALSIGSFYIEYEIEFSEPNLPQALNPSMWCAFSAVPSAGSGNTWTGGRFYGSPELVTSLAMTAGGQPQFLLNVRNPGTQFDAFQIVASATSNTGAATMVSQMQLGVGATTPGTVTNWVSDPTFFSYLDTTGSINMQGNSSPFNRFGNRTGPAAGTNAVAATVWRFMTNVPVTLAFTAPTCSAGNVDLSLVFSRCDDDQTPRTRAHAPFISANQWRNIENFLANAPGAVAALCSAVNGFVDEVDKGLKTIDTVDVQYLLAFRAACGSRLPAHVPPPTAAPLFLPLLASAASWLLAKVGPTIASGLLGYGVKKLEEYSRGEPEEPTRAERRRLRKDRRREADGSEPLPDV